MNKPFAEDGAFAENIRAELPDDDTELRESLKAYGWNPEFPALADENGVILVGHRRIKIAEKLGIAPVIKTLHFGKGDAADAERVKIAIISNTGAKPLTAKDRKHIAQHLYGAKEWTMKRIAKALNVHTSTIGEDLANFPPGGKSKPAKTAANPKGAGRPKGKRKAAPKHDKARDVVRPLVEAGEPINRQKLAADHGLTEGAIQRAELAERARLEAMADPVIDPATLSKSAQEKFAAAIRQHKKNLDQNFQQELESRISKWVDDVGARHFLEQYDKIKFLIEHRGGVITSRNYALVLSCLHPDSRNSLSDEKMAEAFRIFAAIKHKLCDNREMPVKFPPIPTTRAEWEARRKSRNRTASTSQTVQ